MQKRKNKKSKKQPWQGAAKGMALGLMCLASFVAAPCPEALAADNLTISGAQGGSCSTPGAWATFNFGTTSYTSGWGGSSAGADFTPTPPYRAGTSCWVVVVVVLMVVPLLFSQPTL